MSLGKNRALLSATDLAKSYEGNGAAVRALDGVSLEVPDGSFVVIMGPSGSGKSTLLHLLGALDSPTSGEVIFQDKPLSSLKDKALSQLRRHEFGFVFQFFSLVPVLNAEENVALPAVIDGISGAEYKNRVNKLLETVGVAQRKNNLPSELSGGEQQRVAVARALMLEPSVLLADEPTGNLDSKNGLEILGLLKDLQSEGQTIVMVTHDPRAAAFGDWVLHLRDGKVSGRLDLGTAEGGDDRAGAVLAWLQTLEKQEG